MSGMSLGLGMGLSPGRRAVSPIASLFADGADGFDFDFSKLDLLFQENTGPTPADEPNEVIGLALDSHSWGGKTLAQVTAAQAELSTNGDFTGSLAPWTILAPGGSVTWVSNGVVSYNRVGSNARTSNAVSVVAGRLYRLRASALKTSGTGNMVAVLRDGPGGNALSALLNFNVSSAAQETYWLSTVTGTVYINFERTTTDGAGEAYFASLKEVPGNHGIQATTGFKPKYQVNGGAFDGNDDYQSTPYAAGAGSTHCIVARVVFPAVMSSAYIATSFSGTSRFLLGATNTGRLRVGVGEVNDIVPTGNVLGTEAVVGMSCDGTTVRGFVDGAEVYTSAQLGAPHVTRTMDVGCLMNAATPQSFFPGNIKRLIVARKALTLSDFLAIRAQILTGA